MELKLWKDKSKKLLEPDLFSVKAENLAKKVSDEGGDRVNKPSQIRKFYDEVIRFKSEIKINPSEFSERLPYLQMLNAKAAYASGRNLVSNSFKDFISSALSQVKDKDDFDAFSGFFEAFMGYHKFYDEKKKHQGGRR